MPIVERRGKKISPRNILGIRKDGSSSSVSIGGKTPTEPIKESGIAGETIDVSTNTFFAAYDKINQVWKKSTDLSSDNLAAMAIFTTSASINQTVGLQTSGIAEINGADFDITRPVYASTGTPNYTQELKTEKSSTADLRQVLGYPVSGTQILLKFQLPPHRLTE